MAMADAQAAAFFRAQGFPSWAISRRTLEFYLSTLFSASVNPG
jgi:hypothetical protein